MVNSFGKVSELKLEISKNNGKTIISDVYFTAPYKIAKPFRFSENGLKILIMTASSGIMSGDDQNVHIEIKKNATAFISSQSYEKIHKMDSGYAKRESTIKVEKNATLIYAPQPTIPFKGSSFKSKNKIYLSDKTSRLIFSDILTCGRSGTNEKFEFNQYSSYNSIYENDKLVVRDNMYLNPKQADLSGFGFFEGKTHLGTMFICNFDVNEEIIGKIRQAIEIHKLDGGASFLQQNNICIRTLGNNSQQILDFFDNMIELLNMN